MTGERESRSPRELGEGVRELIRSQNDLLGNAMSLVGTTLVTAILGVAYWWVAARLLSPESVGYGSAALAAMTLLAMLGTLGFGTFLANRLAAGVAEPGRLVATGLFAAGVASAVLGLAYAVVVPHVSTHFAGYVATGPEIALFVASVALTSISLVLDNALVGLFLGPLQLVRNVAFGLLKLALLVGVAVWAADERGVDIIFAWTTGILLSFLVVSTALRRRGARVIHVPRVRGMRQVAGPALMHHWLNLASYSPRTALPLIVTGILSATSNGAFYPAWIVATTIYILPIHLSTSLFTVGSANPSVLRAKTQFSIRTALVVGVPLSLAVLAVSHYLLDLFGASYAANATRAMQLLMLAYVPNVVRAHYVTLKRLEDRVGQATVVMVGLGLLELGAAAAGARVGGLTGLAVALTAAMWLGAFLTVKPVLAVMLPRSRW